MTPRKPLRRRAIVAAFSAGSALALLSGALAGPDEFTTGPVIEDFGPVAEIDADFAVPEGTVLRVVFDVAASPEDDSVSRHIEKIARFINMHGEGSQAPTALDLVLVVHGGAHADLLNETQERTNANASLVRALLDEDVRVILCGQTAAHYGVLRDELIEGVEMATSAMTAHAVLQSQGYAVMPF